MKLHNLQILRGISAFLVCCFHFREDVNFAGLKAGEILFKSGSIGVPIFFVISGFIMSYTTQNLFTNDKSTSSEITQFFKRRIIRIVPLYYLLTFLWIIVSGSLVLYITDKALLSRLVYSLLFLPQQNVPPVLFLGWSLNFEVFFYFVFGISIIFKQYRTFFIISFFATFYTLGHFFSFPNALWMMVTSVLNLYFVMGILIFLILNKFTFTRKKATLLSTFGIALFMLFYFRIITITNELLLVGIVSGLVFAFLLLDYVLRIKGNKYLIFLGDISYSLYLSHPFIEVFFRRFKPDGYFTIPFFIIKLFCAIFLASFLYFLFEKKLTHFLKVKLKA
jgi:peptidoglycan/LPS O-acetylase OafA/YrhL